MKRLLIIIGFAALLAALLTMACGCGNRGGKAAVTETEAADTVATGWDNLPDEPVFDIITTMGTVRIKLYAKTPKHRENFIKLVRAHYYDGVLFHRVINNFMIQAGDPLTKDATRSSEWGTGGPNYTIPAEFVPEYYHKKGALAAARRGDAANPKKASHGSQFYLVQDEFNCLQLDGEYTVFGETVQGFAVIDKIAAVPTDAQDRPLKNVKILRIVLSSDQDPMPEDPESSYEAFTADDSSAEGDSLKTDDQAEATGQQEQATSAEQAEQANPAEQQEQVIPAEQQEQANPSVQQEQAAPTEQPEQANPAKQTEQTGQGDQVIPAE